jgi:hypothetical protein
LFILQSGFFESLAKKNTTKIQKKDETSNTKTPKRAEIVNFGTEIVNFETPTAFKRHRGITVAERMRGAQTDSQLSEFTITVSKYTKSQV